MKRFFILSAIVAVLAAAPITNAQVDWRFGFEDTWAILRLPWWVVGSLTSAQKDTLLCKLEIVTEKQKAGGDINFPFVTWGEMQPYSGADIKFREKSDPIVQLLQKHGFSVLWNLRIKADWVSVDNPDCYGLGDCAPDTAHEDDLYNYIYAIVERYDNDGFMDMGYETPDDPTDDLELPIQFYLMIGEIEFAGATPQPEPGYGDEARNHFWTDSIENLLKTHRIIYQAIHDADPSGYSKLISSGGVFFDLYSDFSDWPEIEGPKVQARLNGANNHNAIYVESYNRLKQMLVSFGDDSDGIECDYIGWHPHMPWREIEQTFTFIKTYSGGKPIYVDDMWCNIFLQDRTDAPGNSLFTGGGAAIEGDFPNSLVPGYTALKHDVLFNNKHVVDWYYARHARTIVKAFASVFGEGAERACISGINDVEETGIWPLIVNLRESPLGYINIMGTSEENFFKKPGYYTYKLLIEKLHDFTKVEEIKVSNDPRTRIYEFQRPSGPVYVSWSETGEAPLDLDYRNNPTGETVTLEVKNSVAELILTHIITDTANTNPEVKTIATENGRITIQLGYEPFFLEGDYLTDVQCHSQFSLPSSFLLEQNYPNPFNPESVIEYQLPRSSDVEISIYNLKGQKVTTLIRANQPAGFLKIIWNGKDESGRTVASGVYLYQLKAGDLVETKKMTLLR